MKRFFFLAVALTMALSSVAQEYSDRYQSKTEPQTLLPVGYMRQSRKEVLLPEVNGYTPYRVDLHMHSTYSDGVVNIKGRVNEAWCDGLDAIAMTEHLSIRPVPEAGQPTPEKVAAKRGSNASKSVADAIKHAEAHGLLVIPGIELTGNAKTQGHFNALFTTDNKAIYDYDPMQCIRNARKQGALIMHNHPGWRHSTLDMTQFEKDTYAEKLIDGVEIMNGAYFYPRAFDTAKKHNLFITSNTDIHPLSSQVYRENGHLRNMTIIFAKESTLEGLREGLEAHRTLAYAFGTIGGEEKLLKDFFEAAIKTKKLTEDKKKKLIKVMLTNTTSLPYTISVGGGNPIVIRPLSSVIVSAKPGKPVSCKVHNMWYGMDLHPTVKLKY